MSGTGREPIRVLHVDDDPNLVESAALFLQNEHPRLDVVTATSAQAGLDRLATADVDCIVSDYEMPRMDGLDFLEAVREQYPELPFILFTGKGSEEIASEAISAGVTEYLQKGAGTDQYTLLANRIERAVAETRARRALEESERMFSTLISNLPGMVYRARNDPDWPMSFVSEGCRGLTGYEPAALEDGSVEWGPDVIHEDDFGTMWALVQEALEAREPFEVTYRIRTADDEVKWVWEQGRGVYESGEVVAMEGVITDITDRRRAEQSRRKYEQIVETMADAAFILDAEGRFEFVNQAFLDVGGFERAAVLGEGVGLFADATDASAREQYRALVDRLASGEQSRGVAELPVNVDGRGTRTFDLRLTRFEEDGEFQGIIGIARDVTEQRARERELERYEMLVENVGDPMYALEPDATISMVNEAMADHLDCTPADLVGEPVSTAIPDADVATGTELIADLLDDGRRWGTFEMETISVDGERTITEDKIGVLTDDAGTYAGSVGVIRDISDRKERERELERYETIIQAVGDPVYALDADGNYTFLNDAIHSTTGYEPADLLGEHISVMLDDADVREGERLIRELLESDDRSNATYEMDLLTSDGDRVPSENHLALLPFDDEFRGTAGIVRDITERKQRERKLERFASVVSHDLRNPLNVIEGRIELAQEAGEVSNLDHALASVHRMRRLIDDLLTLAREGQAVSDVHPVDVADVVDLAWRGVDTGAATLRASDLGTVTADGERLRELFENLFRNAVEHGGADVTVSVGSLDAADGFYVADDGDGIPPDERERVFERGFSTSDRGTGFGLSIVENIAEAHGWNVRVTESADGGTRFEIAW